MHFNSAHTQLSYIQCHNIHLTLFHLGNKVVSEPKSLLNVCSIK